MLGPRELSAAYRYTTQLPGALESVAANDLIGINSHIYYNFCLPHTSLRQPLPLPESTNGTGSAKVWRPCTPAMAAGLTEHVWSLKEVLLYRVPPWPQAQTV